MKLSQKNLSEVSFPVGGIGAGCLGISGSAGLIDWEIFNHAGKGLRNGISHFAVRSERDGKVEAIRILNGDQEKALNGECEERNAMFHGFGWGPSAASMCGFPHFRVASFNGEFPVGEFDFDDPTFPGHVQMTVWSAFVPGESDLSSMQCAMFEISLHNNTEFIRDYSFIGVLSNFWNNPNASNQFLSTGSLKQLITGNNEPQDSFERGEVALSTDSEDVSWQEYLCRGAWNDSLEVYLNDLRTPGKFKNRVYFTGEKQHDSGLLSVHKKLFPGETGTVRFILSWFVPNRRNTWTPTKELEEYLNNSPLKENRWKNYYAAKLCSSASEAVESIFAEYESIRKKVFQFRCAIHSSTIPKASLEGAAENLAVLISPTCLRLEDGTFWGWEGVGRELGACPGSCQHVWNYAQALSLLFPDLERSMREAHLKYGVDSDGGLHFRLMLPIGIEAQTNWFRPCVDGAFGEIMKTYREWKISGDSGWMRSLWPKLRKVLEYTWSTKNPDRWDPEKSGLLSGRQHHTLDMELFGPSGWLEGHYLAALKAASEMARICGDNSFAEDCLAIFRRGQKAAEAQLFNGEYYIQKIDLSDSSVLSPYDSWNGEVQKTYWSEEYGELKYQIGEGCSIDSHLGQWYASLYGIGEIFDPCHVRSTLNAIFHHNFFPSMRQVANTWRVFAINDEGGTLMCVWPDGARRPGIPLPYNSEVMTGFEWAFAAHLVMIGDVAHGEEVAQAIRSRYDGAKRNPWNEIECGSNYARSMASFAMLQAYSGFKYDMVRAVIGFSPIQPGDFQCFWSLGSIWGVYRRKGTAQFIQIEHGQASFSGFDLQAREASINGLPLQIENSDGYMKCKVVVNAGDILQFQ